jgi:hypothetical protein
MWFEVPLPFFLRNTVYGLGWSRPITGLFLAVWIIVYGQVGVGGVGVVGVGGGVVGVG